MVTAMYVIGTIYRTRLLGLRFVERKEAYIGRELWRFFLRYPVFDGCHGEEKIASCVGIAFRNLFATDSYRLLWVWQCPEASRHWHRECSTTLAISREVACKRFVFLFFNRRSTTSWYCNERTSFRLVNLNKCIISNYLQVFSICHVFFFSPIMHYVPKSVWVFFPMLYGSETLTKFPIFYLPKKGAEEQHLKEQIDNHRTLLNWSCNHCLYGKIVTKHFCCLECLINTLYFIQFGLTIKRGLELWTLPQDPLHALMVYSG